MNGKFEKWFACFVFIACAIWNTAIGIPGRTRNCKYDVTSSKLYVWGHSTLCNKLRFHNPYHYISNQLVFPVVYHRRKTHHSFSFKFHFEREVKASLHFNRHHMHASWMILVKRESLGFFATVEPTWKFSYLLLAVKTIEKYSPVEKLNIDKKLKWDVKTEFYDILVDYIFSYIYI